MQSSRGDYGLPVVVMETTARFAKCSYCTDIAIFWFDCAARATLFFVCVQLMLRLLFVASCLLATDLMIPIT